MLVRSKAIKFGGNGFVERFLSRGFGFVFSGLSEAVHLGKYCI